MNSALSSAAPIDDARPLLGILQCGDAPEELRPAHGDYDGFFRRLLGEARFSYRTWRVFDGELPDAVDAADAWLLTGSRHGVYEPHAWIPPLETFIRAVQAAEVPMVGICFGHQIIAQALGGRAGKHDGGWSIGRVDYRWHAGEPVPGIEAGSVPLLAYHQDQVIEPPPGAVTVASSDFCRHAALVIGTRTLTIQPHPEFAPDYVDGLLGVRGGQLDDDFKREIRGTLDQPLASAGVMDSIGRFLLDGIAARAAQAAAKESST